MELSKNTVLITGGTSGFGFEFASKLVALGNTVIITGRNLIKLEETKTLLPGVHAIQSDVSKKEDIISLYDSVVEQFPDLNILINNAGEMRKIILHDHYELPDITRELEINLIGPMRMVQQFLPHLKSKSNAAIMNVTSGIALMSLPLAPVYSASKSGLRSYTQSLRVQLKNTKVKVFELVAPGSSTPLNDRFRSEAGPAASGIVAPGKIVQEGIDGLKNNKYEIYPGPLKLLRFIIRYFPKFVLSQASKYGAKDMFGQ
ncbi:SDR family NAD(P)-dependent oxidoreductase [Mucilaginibacter sp. JRF]|uniref:SDR family oxidoreductase n=1 Tax=Mucilaginibacter sp. JRF TaxID=2780088 RepID=UPI0018815698|nr:SDR family NAD(P)-dependent oxidoreductase [Mucilaginibacter sp. JRF]MBE9583290.1 SDR family NAD(P)-dependent oxidoreductase [Mucilaginibacter sp. JRF]